MSNLFERGFPLFVFALMYIGLCFACVFPEFSPTADAIGVELMLESTILIGIAYFAAREANGDYDLMKRNEYVDHFWSAFQRIVLISAAMFLVDYHEYIGTWFEAIGFFAWNLSMYLGAYSFFFNMRLDWLRKRTLFAPLSKTTDSKYDKFFVLICFNNIYLTSYVKAVFEGSAIFFLLYLKHFQ